MKSVRFVFTILIPAVFIFSGCLKTRSDVGDTEDREVIGHQTAEHQRSEKQTAQKAPVVSEKADDPDTQELLRELNGRIELLEAKLKEKESSDPEREALQKQLQASQGQVELLQEEVTKLQTTVSQMQADTSAGQKNAAAATAVAAKATNGKDAKGKEKEKTKPLSTYDSAEQFFEQKDWKQAIVNYQKYREANPAGVHVPEATYKIAVAFQELGMKDEAKTFYEDVANNHPKSNAAKKAKTRLKGLK